MKKFNEMQDNLSKSIKNDQTRISRKIKYYKKYTHKLGKKKPELIRLINQGLALDDQISETQKFLKKLEKIKEKVKNGKLNIKEKNKQRQINE